MRIRRSDERVEILRGANHICVAAGGLRDAGSGCVPARDEHPVPVGLGERFNRTCVGFARRVAHGAFAERAECGDEEVEPR